MFVKKAPHKHLAFEPVQQTGANESLRDIGTRSISLFVVFFFNYYLDGNRHERLGRRNRPGMLDMSERSGGPGAHLDPHLRGEKEEEPGCDSRVSPGGGDAGPVERWSRASSRLLPGTLLAPPRRARLQRQAEVSEPCGGSLRLSVEVADKGSLTPAMRKRYLKELFRNNSLNSGFGSILHTSGSSRLSEVCAEGAEESGSSGSFWALDPTEHAWMLSAPDGNYDTIAEYLSEDLSLLTRKDFVSGFTVLHWLAKYGRDETLVKLLKLAEKRGSPVNVNLKGSGGLTPLHVAAMHGQYMVLKILVGAFGADVNAMDYSGRRAWQYLRSSAAVEMKELLGASECVTETVGPQNANNNSSSSSSSSSCQPKPESRAELASGPRTTDRWSFGSIKSFFAPLLQFGSRSRRDSVRANS
ncbi:ankyrin repeat domain-containing protein SOWAHD-like [Arapaima gigas]